ncbi:MAG: hypothetical protein ACN4GF_02525 [Lentimonas sp.]
MRSFFLYIVSVTFATSFNLSTSAEFETFTNDAGQSLEAELIELNDSGSSVSLRLRSGSRMEADLSAFSSKDCKRIKKWWAEVQESKSLLQPESRLEISAKMNRKSKGNLYDSWDSGIDDKTKSFFPEVLIQNDELETFRENSVRVVIVAKDLRDPEQRLVVSASTLKSDFYDRSKTVLESEPFRLRLYEYDDSYYGDYAYGYEYEGYAVVIKNSKGEITHFKASKSKYLSNMEVIMNCEAGQMYDVNLNRKLNASPSSYFVR